VHHGHFQYKQLPIGHVPKFVWRNFHQKSIRQNNNSPQNFRQATANETTYLTLMQFCFSDQFSFKRISICL